MKLNSDLRREASDALIGQWGIAAVTSLVLFLLMEGANLSGNLFAPLRIILLLLLLPVYYGYAIVFLDLLREKEVRFQTLFDGFIDYGRILGTMLLAGLYKFLWLLLLIVPGIIKGYSYSMTLFILKDEPELKYNAAIEKSMKMMSGYKMKLFLLDLSFIGWAILCILTLGLGFLFLSPYISTAHAAFYEELKEIQAQEVLNVDEEATE
ncbi:MAG: DUF975 family protein [Bacteroides sp.]|jgi:uncharacterized membrane protein|nr:DUF975 family protein [Bacteroides sp.]MCI1681631.1 DUF975 family protein [Bacteroides sp.]